MTLLDLVTVKCLEPMFLLVEQGLPGLVWFMLEPLQVAQEELVELVAQEPDQPVLEPLASQHCPQLVLIAPGF
jgi:hypothetical protein